MKEASEVYQPAIRERPEYRILLDQLETKIERDGSSLGILDVLSLRLFALHRQWGRLGHVSAGAERVRAKAQEIETDPLVTPEVTAPDTTPAAVPRKMTTNKLHSWLSRRRNG